MQANFFVSDMIHLLFYKRIMDNIVKSKHLKNLKERGRLGVWGIWQALTR